jgi:zinc/manganese transport system substrate-binding protein
LTAAAAVKPLHADAGRGHAHGGIDPHAWQDPDNARLYVTAIRDGLCAADAANCTSYTANATALDSRIADLDAKAHAAFDAIPLERRKVITSHDAFGYFGRAYGITFHAAQGVSTESEASAGDIGALIRQIRDSGITTLFVETITDSRLIKEIASETGARMGGDLYSDALAPAGEPAASYLGMMDHNIKLLAAAMAGGG